MQKIPMLHYDVSGAKTKNSDRFQSIKPKVRPKSVCFYFFAPTFNLNYSNVASSCFGRKNIENRKDLFVEKLNSSLDGLFKKFAINV